MTTKCKSDVLDASAFRGPVLEGWLPQERESIHSQTEPQKDLDRVLLDLDRNRQTLLPAHNWSDLGRQLWPLWVVISVDQRNTLS